MKRLCWLLLIFVLAAHWPAQAGETPSAVFAAPSSPPAEVLAETYLYDIMGHLYRWYLDESDIEGLAGIRQFPFWVRRLTVELDPGDRSQLAEIVLPLLNVAVRVKKADYTIEDWGVAVTSKTFRIINVARMSEPPAQAAEAVEVTVELAQMKDYLFATRERAQYPDDVLRAHLRAALLANFQLEPDEANVGGHIVHVAPLSPVANELWAFVEDKKLLVRFAADLDLDNPALWEHQAIAIRTYDLLRQTVVSLHEMPGSNEFLTRDQVGRALFNCILLGRKY